MKIRKSYKKRKAKPAKKPTVKKTMSEADYAKLLINHCESKGYMCYKEVCASGTGGSRRADCYFVKKAKGEIIETFVVETKTTLNLKVIEQAYKWKGGANKVYIGIPKLKRKPVEARRFALLTCKKLNVGVIEISNSEVKILYEPEGIEKYKLPPLSIEQTKSQAGNANSEYHTTFKKTVSNIDQFMKNRTEYLFKNLIKNIDHHYSNNRSAEGCILNYIRKGIIKNYSIVKKNKSLYIIKKGKQNNTI
jgi:hypothetical protein